MKIYNQMLLLIDSSFSADCMDTYSYIMGVNGMDYLRNPPYPVKRANYRFSIYGYSNNQFTDHGYIRSMNLPNVKDAKQRYTTLYRPGPYTQSYPNYYVTDYKLELEYYK